MKFNCVKCGNLVCNLDLRNPENKEESLTISHCRNCLRESLKIARGLFQRRKIKIKFWKRSLGI